MKLKLEIDPDQIQYIPANVEAQIQATTVFGAKFVDLVYPKRSQPAAPGGRVQVLRVPQRQHRGQHGLREPRRRARSDRPGQAQRVLSALAEGVRGQGDRIGQATTDANQVLLAAQSAQRDRPRRLAGAQGFSDTYSAAAQDILTTLDAASTTSVTVTKHAEQLDALLLGIIGLSNSGISSARAQQGQPDQGDQRAGADDEPAVQVQPGLHLPAPRRQAPARQRRLRSRLAATASRSSWTPACCSATTRTATRDNLPIIGAKGGPGGKPGCGSLPDCRRTTGRCASWSPTPVSEPEWTAGPTRASASPATPTTCRSPARCPSRRVSATCSAGPRPGRFRTRALRPTAPDVRAGRHTAVAGLPPAPPPGAPRDPGRRRDRSRSWCTRLRSPTTDAVAAGSAPGTRSAIAVTDHCFDTTTEKGSRP